MSYSEWGEPEYEYPYGPKSWVVGDKIGHCCRLVFVDEEGDWGISECEQGDIPDACSAIWHLVCPYAEGKAHCLGTVQAAKGVCECYGLQGFKEMVSSVRTLWVLQNPEAYRVYKDFADSP